MARNRKHQSAAIRFGPALKALLLCLLIGGSGVGYVWQKEQINLLGRQIQARERRLADLREQNKKLRDQLAMLRSPPKLDQRVRELSLGLGQPDPVQIWRLAEPGSLSQPDADGANTGRSAAAGANNGQNRWETILPPPVTPSGEEPMAAGGRQIFAKSSRTRIR